MKEMVDSVQRMQDYIEQKLDTPITLEELASVAGYSPWYASKLFRELVGIPPFEYLRARRLSRAALKLRDSGERVLSIALESAFESHEGFTRAFSKRFGMTPEYYMNNTPPIRLFLPRSACAVYLHNTKGDVQMSKNDISNIVMTQVIERPARRLILMRGQKATDYWDYCQEVGCDVWDILVSVKGALYEPIGMWLPAKLRTPGTSTYAQGVEVPADYESPIPDGMELIDLPPCQMMVFHGQPFTGDEDMARAINVVWSAIDVCKPEVYGWKWADEEAPRFQLAPIPERGYIEARPVKAI